MTAIRRLNPAIVLPGYPLTDAARLDMAAREAARAGIALYAETEAAFAGRAHAEAVRSAEWEMSCAAGATKRARLHLAQSREMAGVYRGQHTRAASPRGRAAMASMLWHDLRVLAFAQTRLRAAETALTGLRTVEVAA